MYDSIRILRNNSAMTTVEYMILTYSMCIMFSSTKQHAIVKRLFSLTSFQMSNDKHRVYACSFYYEFWQTCFSYNMDSQNIKPDTHIHNYMQIYLSERNISKMELLLSCTETQFTLQRSQCNCLYDKLFFGAKNQYWRCFLVSI